MVRESLVGLKTMREVVTGLDNSRSQKAIKTLNIRRQAVLMPEPNIDEKAIAIVLEKERRRFQRQNEVLRKFHKKIQGMRQKLVNTKEKNRRLMELRLKLQKDYWQNTRSSAPEGESEGKPTKHFANTVKLKY